MYATDIDLVLASERINGTKPLRPDMVPKRFSGLLLTVQALQAKSSAGTPSAIPLLPPAVARQDVTVAQDLLRHANSRTTIYLYSQAISSDKRNANTRAMELLVTSKGICDVL